MPYSRESSHPAPTRISYVPCICRHASPPAPPGTPKCLPWVLSKFFLLRMEFTSHWVWVSWACFIGYRKWKWGALQASQNLCGYSSSLLTQAVEDRCEWVPPPAFLGSFLGADKCLESCWGSVHGQSPAFGSGLEIVNLGSQLVCVESRELSLCVLRKPSPA